MMYIILNINVKKNTCSLKVHKRPKKFNVFTVIKYSKQYSENRYKGYTIKITNTSY